MVGIRVGHSARVDGVDESAPEQVSVVSAVEISFQAILAIRLQQSDFVVPIVGGPTGLPRKPGVVVRRFVFVDMPDRQSTGTTGPGRNRLIVANGLTVLDQEIFAGIGLDPVEALTITFDEKPDGGTIILRDLSFYSMCEHHLLPFFGKCHVGYLPRDKVVGHQRVYDLAGLTADLQAGGFEVIESKGFFLKTLPNSMMLDYSDALIAGLNEVGEQLPAELLANLAVRVRLASGRPV